MKKLALISSYCETKEKLDVLKNTCQTLKSLGVDTFVSSPIKIEVESDFLFFTKENPILKWPDKGISLWRTIFYEGRELKLQPMIDDPGWASLYQIKKLMEFGLTYNYDIFYVLIYDLNIDERIISDIQSNVYNVTYPRRDFTNHEIVFPATFHLSIFDKHKLTQMSKLIDYNTYTTQNGFAENFIERWSDEVGMIRSNHIVTDLINITPKDPFNMSKHKGYRFFINKDEKQKVKFYVREFDSELVVLINDIKFNVKNNPTLIETELNFDEVYSLVIKYGGEIIDYSEDYRKITKNILEFV